MYTGNRINSIIELGLHNTYVIHAHKFQISHLIHVRRNTLNWVTLENSFCSNYLHFEIRGLIFGFDIVIVLGVGKEAI